MDNNTIAHAKPRLLPKPPEPTHPAGHPRAERKQRGTAYGWTWVSDPSCPRKLVGKRCKGFECWCHGSFGYRWLNDHGATWKDRNGTRFVLWEPYGPVVGEALAELRHVANRCGLETAVTASTWYPPHTIGIAFYANPSKASLEAP